MNSVRDVFFWGAVLLVIFVLCFALVEVLTVEPKFHYGDKVIVTDGFFTGQEGIIVDHHGRTYTVSLSFGEHQRKIWGSSLKLREEE